MTTMTREMPLGLRTPDSSLGCGWLIDRCKLVAGRHEQATVVYQEGQEVGGFVLTPS
jgi:hypothetical protein